MNINRNYDLKDIITNTQRTTMGNAPTSTPHFIGLSFGEPDVFDSGATLLASIKSTPDSKWLTHIAVGDDGTAIDKATQTELISEIYREQLALWHSIVPLSAGSSTYMVQIYLPAIYGTYHIREIGIFGTTSTPGDTLFIRGLLDFDNSTNPIDLMISGILTFNGTGGGGGGGTSISFGLSSLDWT